jgi:hypothetical protein
MVFTVEFWLFTAQNKDIHNRCGLPSLAADRRLPPQAAHIHDRLHGKHHAPALGNSGMALANIHRQKRNAIPAFDCAYDALRIAKHAAGTRLNILQYASAQALCPARIAQIHAKEERREKPVPRREQAPPKTVEFFSPDEHDNVCFAHESQTVDNRRGRILAVGMQQQYKLSGARKKGCFYGLCKAFSCIVIYALYATRTA